MFTSRPKCLCPRSLRQHSVPIHEGLFELQLGESKALDKRSQSRRQVHLQNPDPKSAQRPAIGRLLTTHRKQTTHHRIGVEVVSSFHHTEPNLLNATDYKGNLSPQFTSLCLQAVICTLFCHIVVCRLQFSTSFPREWTLKSEYTRSDPDGRRLGCSISCLANSDRFPSSSLDYWKVGALRRSWGTAHRSF